MNDRCSVCSHKDRSEIDEALVSGSVPLRTLGRRFGLGKDALSRHRKRHLVPAVRAEIVKRVEEGRARDLVDTLEEGLRACQLLLDVGLQEGKGALALGAIRELRGTVEAMFRLVEVAREQERLDQDRQAAAIDYEAIDVEIRRLERELAERGQTVRPAPVSPPPVEDVAEPPQETSEDMTPDEDEPDDDEGHVMPVPAERAPDAGESEERPARRWGSFRSEREEPDDEEDDDGGRERVKALAHWSDDERVWNRHS